MQNEVKPSCKEESREVNKRGLVSYPLNNRRRGVADFLLNTPPPLSRSHTHARTHRASSTAPRGNCPDAYKIRFVILESHSLQLGGISLFLCFSVLLYTSPAVVSWELNRLRDRGPKVANHQILTLCAYFH